MSADRSTAASHVLSRFRWVDGDADTWNMLREAHALESIVSELSHLAALDAAGARLVNVVVIVDQADDAARRSLPDIRSIVIGADLP